MLGQAAEVRFDDSIRAHDSQAMKSSSLEEIAERGRLAHRLKSRGSKVSEIAMLLGCSHWRVCQALNFHMARHHVDADIEDPDESELESRHMSDEP